MLYIKDNDQTGFNLQKEKRNFEPNIEYLWKSSPVFPCRSVLIMKTMSAANPTKAVHPGTDTLLGIDIGSVTISLSRWICRERSWNGISFSQRTDPGMSQGCRTRIDLKSVRGIAVCAAPCFNPEKVVFYNPQVAAHQGSKDAEPGKVPVAGWR